MTDSLSIRDQVCAELADGETYLRVALRHNINEKTAARWFAESGLTRTPAKTHKPLTPDRRKAIERMIREGASLRAIRLRVKCGNQMIEAVRAGMERADV